MDEGWVKLHRAIWNHWIWKDPDKLRAWLDLIMLANHKPNKICINNQIVTIEVGQRWTSFRNLSLRWGWSVKRVSNFLKLLQSDDMVTVQTTKNGTLINIVNYRVYQGFLTDEETPTTTPTTTRSYTQKKHRLPTNKNDKRMIKNDKNKKGEGDWQ